MLSQIIVIGLLAFFGVIVQTVAGFGLAFFILPALLAYFSPPTAVTITLLVADVSCLLILFAEKRRRQFSWSIVLRLALFAVPGLILGAFIMTRMRKEILQIIIGVLIILAVLVQEYVFPKATKPLRFSKWGALSGFTAGALNAAASMAPPPLVLWLRSYKTSLNQIRDTLSVSFLIMNNASILVIYFFKPVSLTVKGLTVFAIITPLIILGNYVGRRLLPKINPKHHRKILFILVFLAGCSSIALGINKLR
jgi:uncharacterized membrane protein YfcA